MAVITAYKCEHTGKIFESKDSYQSHLRKLSRIRVANRKIQAVELARHNFFRGLQSTIASIEDLKNAIIEHQDMFWADAAASESFSWSDVGRKRRGVHVPVPKLVKFTQFELTFTPTISNSHSCPRGGVTNWGGMEKDAPRHYPGWQGRIEWEIKWPKELDGMYPGSDLFKGRNCGIHTGTGGWRGRGGMKNGIQSFGYDVNIFATDWPAMYLPVSKKRMWEALEGKL
jgi:hypothetical protein